MNKHEVQAHIARTLDNTPDPDESKRATQLESLVGIPADAWNHCPPDLTPVDQDAYDPTCLYYESPSFTLPESEADTVMLGIQDVKAQVLGKPETLTIISGTNG